MLPLSVHDGQNELTFQSNEQFLLPADAAALPFQAATDQSACRIH